ncbi:MAG: VWA domain-containing protein [Anaerolineae bacterium]|nr:VWA domain-containing protein [Anaerolineae bacterium]
MDKRMIDFIRALRAAGVRISLAESQDAMYGAEALGVESQSAFRAALSATLVKEHRDQEVFEQFFPLFFGSNTPLMNNIPDNLTEREQKMLEKALRSLAGQLAALKDLLRQLVEGKPYSEDELGEMGQRAGLNAEDDMKNRRWMERRMRSQADLEKMQMAIDMLIEKLKSMGMSDEKAEELRDMLEENLEGLNEQVSNYTGRTLAENRAEQDPKPSNDVLDIPLQRLSDDDAEQIRREIRRLAAKLRSRASLRHKRSKDGDIDLRRTMRANMKYQGVPVELRRKTRHVKPALVLICDVSTSVRYCAEFLLTLIYELQDQVARTNSFIFIGDLVDISMDFKEHEPMEAVQRVLNANPPGYYSTDLGNALNTFKRDHMGTIGGKTTVIILGDGRNNHNDPRIDIAEEMHRKSRRLIWFNPENPASWGSGDSDMLAYQPASDGVYYVRTLRDLADAVDKVLADG